MLLFPMILQYLETHLQSWSPGPLYVFPSSRFRAVLGTRACSNAIFFKERGNAEWKEMEMVIFFIARQV